MSLRGMASWDSVSERLERMKLKEIIHQTPLTSSVPVRELPAELLVKIFLYLRDSFSRGAYDAYAWTSILLVSKTWYHVAIQCPHLWTELSLSIPAPLCFVERSRGLPLIVSGLPQDDVASHPLGPYSSCLSRTRELFLTGVSHDNVLQLFGDHTSLPLLEELAVLLPISDHPPPDILKTCHYPKLACLWLSLSFDFRCKHNFCAPNLRLLYLKCVQGEQGLTLTELTNNLKNMPLLCELHVINAISVAEGENNPTTLRESAIELRLMLLAIVGSVEMCTALLNSVALPRYTNIDINSILPKDANEQMDAVEHSLSELAEALDDKIIKARNEESVGVPLSPMEYMLVEKYFDEDESETNIVHGKARLCCMRTSGQYCGSCAAQLQNLMFSHEIKCDQTSKSLRTATGGVQLVLSWEAHPDRVDILADWPARICHNWPLEQVTTIAVDLWAHTTSTNLRDMCPNVTIVYATDQGSEFKGLRYLLDCDNNGNYYSKRPHWAGMKTLILDRIGFGEPSALHLELDSLRLSLRGLRIARTLTLEKIYFMTSFSDDNITPGVHNSLKELKAAFPEIDIVMVDGLNFSKWTIEC
ncbi:hypothetical protein BDY19DRAFT_624951 [Irpex rosettiformis]|uniref:Uncharacterized protein n=1 Tax=Irpex rosettiformis TaxID=378272 RepID=A0ACB8UBG3_9APHY|nr:hypothetical protein BDY19DRAFT_624951 [Irpex rosettiformis]